MWLRFIKLLVTAAALSGPLASVSDAAEPPPPLPNLHANGNKTSVSGLSSGGYMAGQYGVVFSSSVKGVGIVAAGPFGCFPVYFTQFLPFLGAGTPLTAFEKCMTGEPRGNVAYFFAKGLEGQQVNGQRLIDSMDNLKHQKIYIFTGKRDSVVTSRVADATKQFYERAGANKKKLRYVDNISAEHAFIFPQVDTPCEKLGGLYIVHCEFPPKVEYDQPREILKFIYGKLHAPAQHLSSAPVAYSQKEFIPPARDGEMLLGQSGFDDAGYVYIPAMCKDEKSRGCSVHVVFHGCLQAAEKVQAAVDGSPAYNRWADTNSIIVLYPQIKASDLGNKGGCWDWYGYSTSLVVQSNTAPQMAAVKAMVDRLTNR